MESLFTWPVPEAGHTWVRAEGTLIAVDLANPEAKKDRWLVAPPSGDWREYGPMAEEPALFRTFAELEPSEAEVKQFADAYGLLGAHQAAIPRGRRRRLCMAERIAGWRAEILRMRAAVDLFGAAREGSAKLEGWLTVGQGIVRYRRSFGSRLVHFDAGGPGSPLAEHIDAGHLERCAMLALQTVVNRALEGQTSWRLLFDPEADDLVPRVAPSNLLAALWLQLAQAITEERSFVRCAQCGKWLAIARATGTRSTRELCSDPCKSAAYRDRKRRAHALSAEGMTPAAIAREVGSTTATVRGWLRAKR